MQSFIQSSTFFEKRKELQKEDIFVQIYFKMYGSTSN